ncbi:MAG: hypothetical protein HOP23_15840 [Methylococcaceae bacterium]|nr:hypothetical protein [Methylococcaceae bacterium]
MHSIIVNINGLLKLDINFSDYKVIDIGFMVSPGKDNGELQCCATPLVDGKRSIIGIYQVNTGDTVEIYNNEFNHNHEDVFFSKQKIIHLMEMFKETNSGNPCKHQIHFSMKKKDRYAAFGSGTCNIIFKYLWSSNKELIECSIGNIEESGSEQWLKSCISPEQNVEFLFLSNS